MRFDQPEVVVVAYGDCREWDLVPVGDLHVDVGRVLEVGAHACDRLVAEQYERRQHAHQPDQSAAQTTN